MEFSVPGIVRGYHVYQRIWTPFVGERATTVREPDNEHDRYAVAVLEDETLCTVGHLPREISKADFQAQRSALATRIVSKLGTGIVWVIFFVAVVNRHNRGRRLLLSCTSRASLLSFRSWWGRLP